MGNNYFIVIYKNKNKYVSAAIPAKTLDQAFKKFYRGYPNADVLYVFSAIEGQMVYDYRRY